MDNKKLASYLDKAEKVYCYEDDKRMYLSEGCFIFATEYSHELAKYRPVEKWQKYIYELGVLREGGYDIMKLWNGNVVGDYELIPTNFLYECQNWGKASAFYRKFTDLEGNNEVWLNKKVLEIFAKDYTDFQAGSDIRIIKIKNQRMVKVLGRGCESIMMQAGKAVGK